MSLVAVNRQAGKHLKSDKSDYINYMFDKLHEFFLAYQSENLSSLFYDKDELENRRKNEIQYIKINSGDIVLVMYRIYRLEKLVNNVTEIIDEANNMLLYKRYLREDEDWIIRGIINWPKTLINLARNLPPSQMILWYSLNSPENLLLRMIVNYLKDWVNELNELLSNNIVKLVKGSSSALSGTPRDIEVQIALSNLKSALRRVRNLDKKLINSINESFLEYIPQEVLLESRLDIYDLVDEVHYTPWKPQWVENLLEIIEQYIFSKRIEDDLKHIYYAIMNKIIKEVLPKDLVEAMRMYAYKLYELYNLYVIVKAFEKLGASISLRNKTMYVRIDDKKFEISFNKPFDTTVTEGETKNMIGKLSLIPDITIEGNERKIVLEAKFSSNPSYLLQGFFKAVSYLTLHNANVGVLTYPLKPLKQTGIEETREFYGILTGIGKEDIIIETNDKKTIHILMLEPRPENEEKNLDLVLNIIREVFGI